MMSGINNLTYSELLCKYSPQPISCEENYDVIQSLVNQIIDLDVITEDTHIFLNLLGMLIEDYERLHLEEMQLYGVDLIKALMREHGLKQKDLVAIFKTESIVSAVLNGHRKLTVSQIEKLSAFFNLPHGYFFAGEQSQTAKLKSKTALSIIEDNANLAQMFFSGVVKNGSNKAPTVKTRNHPLDSISRNTEHGFSINSIME